jgi:hypothetical protein
MNSFDKKAILSRIFWRQRALEQYSRVQKDIIAALMAPKRHLFGLIRTKGRTKEQAIAYVTCPTFDYASLTFEREEFRRKEELAFLRKIERAVTDSVADTVNLTTSEYARIIGLA